ncbi:type II toxin-antitoxin system Phd/YefM family antitoxin [Candidatus Binatia bacterium]|nr:type II toxin-antitoxin system Phd/YefM family antitoxin [Candidatus Binatia bacterium]
MKHTNVSGLKARLSAYLADVRGGETVIVCDRNHPIAQIVPVDGGAEDDLRIEPARGRLPALRELPRIRLRRKVDVVATLRESRDQR